MEEGDEEWEEYYVWNRAQYLYELMSSSGNTKTSKDLDTNINSMQFSRFSRVPELAKVGQFFKADLDIVFKNMQRKYDTQSLDIHGFFNAIEILVPKVFKTDTFVEGL